MRVRRPQSQPFDAAAVARKDQRQYVDKWVWLCANKTLRKQTEAGSGPWAMRVTLCMRWTHQLYRIETAPVYSFRTQNWIFKLSTNVLELPLPKGAVLHCWREGKLVQPLWKTAQRFLRKLKKKSHCVIQQHIPGHFSRQNSSLKGYKAPSVHSSAIYSS